MKLTNRLDYISKYSKKNKAILEYKKYFKKASSIKDKSLKLMYLSLANQLAKDYYLVGGDLL
jgi:hypothetical protein